MKKTIKDIDWAGKQAVMRCDFNVPLDGDKITDDIRIRDLRVSQSLNSASHRLQKDLLSLPVRKSSSFLLM